MIRVLLLADTHLGFDLPARPRSERRRRGPDFFAMTRLALAPARRGEVDLVVHGGDLLFRSKVPASLVQAALEPLLEAADRGVPVVLVPGNHERSALPYPLLASHEHLHVFDRARTIALEAGGSRVALVGFPCLREGAQDRFAALAAAAARGSEGAPVRLLCLHQTIEGAAVEGHVFRGGDDVIRGRDLPEGFAAVLCGHIHRAQVLTRDLTGRPLAAPVLYPGSVERTSFAERHEAKGFMVLELEPDPATGGRLAGWELRELPARPMVAVEVDASGCGPAALEERLREALAPLPSDAVVQLRVTGELAGGAAEAIRAASLRRLHLPTMSVSVRLASAPHGARGS
ncbi:MAG: metallophosphoesterase [Thermoanaerobaculales bacterium]|nr:metallophosphoesterase [Thermoanaerobaculales bacterium]